MLSPLQGEILHNGSTEVAAGKENFPANGITFDRAKAYCAWLSKATGRKYRLPSEGEADERPAGCAGARPEPGTAPGTHRSTAA